MAIKDNDISDLIPDYCNNRLNAQEKADFESLLREDHKLLDECNDFQGFQKFYRRIDPAKPLPSEAIFNQISRTVSAQQKTARKAPAHSNPPTESLRSLWQLIRKSMAVPWMLAAAQTVAIVLLLLPAPEQNTFSTLSTMEAATNAEKNDVNVVFRPNAPESDIRNLLHTIQGSLSSGPSREGRYVVTISSRGNLDKAVRTLKQSEVVLLAEPVY